MAKNKALIIYPMSAEETEFLKYVKDDPTPEANPPLGGVFDDVNELVEDIPRAPSSIERPSKSRVPVSKSRNHVWLAKNTQSVAPLSKGARRGIGSYFLRQIGHSFAAKPQ